MNLGYESGSKLGTFDEKKRRWKISRYCPFKKVPSNELCTFMMWIEDDRFACHIINKHWRPPSHIHDVDRLWDIGGFATISIRNKKVHTNQGNKESKNQQMGDTVTDKKIA